MRTTPSAAVITLAAAALVACSEQPAPRSTDAARPVRTVEVAAETITETAKAAGTLASRAEMPLAFKVPGYLAEIFVDEGQQVARGEVLARLQTTEVEAQLRAARAGAELASKTLARVERLFADSVVTEARLDEARDAHERAQAGLRIAEYNLEYASIRAPSDGRILGRSVDVAEYVGPGAPVFTFGSTTSGWVARVGLPDRQVVRVSKGNRAVVSMRALGLELTGEVVEIADAADPGSGTFDVEVALPGAPPALRSGMVAQVSVELSGARPLVHLPTSSIVEAQGLDASVFVVEGGVANLRAVRVVSIGARGVVVEPEAVDGAEIVTEGAAYLRDGDRVAPTTSF